MRVKDLDGKVYELKLTGHIVDGSESKPRSDLHRQAREIIREKFPLLTSLEELPVKLYSNATVYLDFFLPQSKLCIEVNGRQHFEFIQHFHSNLMGFKLHQKRDREKREWLDLNNIKLVEFNYNEDVETWKNKL